MEGYDRVADGKASSTETRATPIGQQRTTGQFSRTLTAGCGDTWTGLRKLPGAPEGADFVLDGFTVTDLGPAPAGQEAVCGTLDVAADAETLEPGAPNTVKATFGNDEATAATGVKLALTVPEGWQAEPVGAVAFDSVAPGAKATGSWRVTPPVDAPYGTYALDAEATYTVGGAARALGAGTSVRTLRRRPPRTSR